MAHENLKFNLNPTKYDIWQPILGSQAHGTFYMIYIRFTKEVIDSGANAVANDYYCEFRLQNFRGCVTMGLVELPRIDFDDSANKDEPDFIINIKIAPFVKNDKLKRFKYTIDRALKNDDIIHTSGVVLRPPIYIYDPEDYDNSLYLPANEVLRDGDDYLKVCTKPYKQTKWDCDKDGFGIFPGVCDMSMSVIAS